VDVETAKERVLKAINHIQPEITPVHIIRFELIEKWLEHFGAKDDYSLRDKLDLDIRTASAIHTGPNSKRGLSIWGAKQDLMGYEGYGYSTVRDNYPLAKAASITDIDHFPWPNPDDFDYKIVGKVLGKAPDKACFAKPGYTIQQEGLTKEDSARGSEVPKSSRGSGSWMPILCTLFELFGLEETLVKLHKEPKLIEAAISHIESFILEFSRRLLDATRGVADIYYFGDDFAGKGGMLLSPEHWRRYLKPSYKRIFELAKGYDLKVWFHSCGTFRPVLSDLIDIGMDIWETVQVHLPGNEPEQLKREYGQDIAFYGAINSQHTLPFGTPEDVRVEVRERMRVLGRGGGYICGPDHSVLPDVPIENVLAMLDEARK